jgi:crossover junction endodeoxyribonuclease RuvC
LENKEGSTFMPIILGIDPGLQKTGWGVIKVQGNHVQYVGCGAIHTNSKSDMVVRLGELHEGLSQVMQSYLPDTCAIEETFVNKNPLSSLKLGQARGALILTVRLAGLPLGEYPANTIKKTVVGVGHAQKGQVMMMVQQLLPGAQIKSEDAADALAVAICHMHHVNSPLATLLRQKVKA